MKTTIDLPEELVRRLKIRAVQQGKPFKRLVAELLSQSLNANLSAAVPPATTASEEIVLNERGFPVLRCGENAPARRMTAQELIALEKEVLLEEEAQRAGVTL